VYAYTTSYVDYQILSRFASIVEKFPDMCAPRAPLHIALRHIALRAGSSPKSTSALHSCEALCAAAAAVVVTCCAGRSMPTSHPSSSSTTSFCAATLPAPASSARALLLLAAVYTLDTLRMFPVPECVVDALYLWEKERHRLVFTPCSLFRFAASHR
jgi:hypothetical protein